MALKGNLLYNGDFETGTKEGWITGPYETAFDYLTFAVSEEAKKRGNYGGLLVAISDNAQGYLAYDKTFSFEEYEAYLYLLPVKMINAGMYYGVLYGLDDKENLIKRFDMAWRFEENVWRTLQFLLRGIGDITHFRIGLFYYSFHIAGKLYFDEVKLFPLRSIKSHILREDRNFTNLTSDTQWDSVLSCFGRCQLRSVVETRNVSGTSPTLDVVIETYPFFSTSMCLTYHHTQFTGEDTEEIVIDLPEASLIRVKYILGGTSPSFDINHLLRLIPL